jgi:chromosome partitioning protein
MLTIALANLKPGTGKTTSAVWLAQAFHEALYSVLLVDADPAASALEWADLASGFAFGTAPLASKELDRKLPGAARGYDVVVIDAPPGEDHAGIVQAAIRAADDVVIPCAPTPIEVNRTAPMLQKHPELNRAAILLNRTVANANSTEQARTALEGIGFDVLPVSIPRLEIYAQSFGAQPDPTALVPWRVIARTLTDRANMRMARA